MKFDENCLKGSGDIERTRKCYGRNDGRGDGWHSYTFVTSHPLRGGGLTIKDAQEMPQSHSRPTHATVRKRNF